MSTGGDPDYMTPALARWRRATDWPLMALAIGSLPVLLLDFTSDDLPRWDRFFMTVVNVAVLVAFAIDYTVEVSLASKRRSYARHEIFSLLIVAAQALALAPALTAFGVLRALRAARLFRVVAVVVRAVAIGEVAAREGRVLLRQHAASFALGMAGITWLTSAAAFTVAEDVGVGGRVHSFFDALWWSASTITTVGYGDIYPVTAVGRIIGVFTMVVGVSAFAIVTARIARFLVQSDDTAN